MARSKKKKTAPGWLSRLRFWTSESAALSRRGVVRLLMGVIAVLLVVLCGLGLNRVNAYVLATPDFCGPADIRLTSDPPDLRDHTHGLLARFQRVPWSSGTLCADLARAFSHSPWVKQVDCVRRFPDRRVIIDCKYRVPFALVQTPTAMCLIDDGAVRLPGEYAFDERFKLIQGVGSVAPRPGECWGAPDLRAAIDIIKLLDGEPYARQVVAVMVHNFGGRLDRRDAHIELATDRASGRIVWGSAVGQEIEENSAAQKLAILRANYQRYGHVDAGHAVIDVSVLPDRILARERS